MLATLGFAVGALAAGAPAAALAAGSCGSGASSSWTGAISSDYSDSANWTNGVPSGGCAATIAAGSTAVVHDGEGAGTLTLGGTLTVEGYTRSDGQPQEAYFNADTLTIGSTGTLKMTSSGAVPAAAPAGTLANPGASIVAGAVVNSGTISVETGFAGPNTRRDLRANVTNETGGGMAFHRDVDSCSCGAGGTWVNKGSWTIDSGVTAYLSRTGAGVRLTQEAGNIANSGRLIVNGGITHTGGTTTGQPVQVCGDLDAHGPGTASFAIIRDPVYCGGGALTGDIGTGNTVLVRNLDPANGQLVVAIDPITNNGTVSFVGTPGNTGEKYFTRAGPFDNKGTLNFDANGRNELQEGLVNDGGTVNVAAGATVTLGGRPQGIIQNDGTTTVGAGATVTSGASTLSGGTIANAGRFASGDFTHSGGSTTGTPIEFCGTLSAIGPGSASFAAFGSPQCTSSSLGSNVGAGDTVRAKALTASFDFYVPSGFVNHGTLILDSAADHPVQPQGSTLGNDGELRFTGGTANVAPTLTNSGTLILDPGAGANFNNPVAQSAGSLTLGDGALLNTSLTLTGGLLGGTGTVASDLTNGGLVRPGSATTPSTLHVGGTYTQTADGVLSARVAAPAHDLLAVGGAATLAGRIDLGTIGTAPAKDSEFQVLTDASQTGTFSSVTGDGYDVAYDPTDVKLVAHEPPPPPQDGGGGTTTTTTTTTPPPTGTVTTPPPGVTTLGPPLLSSSFPGSAPPVGTTTLTLRGSGLTADTAVALTRAALPTITGTDVHASADGRTLTAQVALGGAAQGARDVVVARANGVASLPGVFRVVPEQAASVDAEIVGPSTVLAGYLSTLQLQYTNTGNVPAHNTLIRIDGFAHGADVRVTGPGVTAVPSDSGADESVLVRVASIPAGGTGSALVRFTPDGPPHSYYDLDATVVQDTREETVRAGDGPLQASNQVLTSSPSRSTGILHLTAPAAGDVSYDIKHLAGSGPAEPTLSETTSGGRTTLLLDAAIPPDATAPPSASARASLRGAPATLRKTAYEHIQIRMEAEKKLFDNFELYNSVTAIHEFTLSRKQINRCLRNRHYITQEQYYTLDRYARGGETISLMNLAVGKSPADAAAAGEISIQFSLLEKVAVNSWEGALVGSNISLQPHYGILFSTQDAEGGVAQGNPLHEQFRDLPVDSRLRKVVQLCFPPKIPRPHRHRSQVFRSGDPNGKDGPSGYGKGQYIPGGTPVPYAVHFENLATATAPAHEVVITDQLDPKKVDLSTLRLGSMYFGDKILTPPVATQAYNGTVDLRPAENLVVDVQASLDRATGLLTWDFRGLDPATGALQTLPELGFLPPNKATPAGQGGVTFTVDQAPGLKTKTTIANAARIVFDRNAPIDTPTYVNTIDTTFPTSRVTKVKRSSRRSCRGLKVTWAGKDTGAGVATYDVLVARGAGRFKPWRVQTAKHSAVYRTPRRGTYRFRSFATDGVGHVQKRTSKAATFKARC